MFISAYLCQDYYSALPFVILDGMRWLGPEWTTSVILIISAWPSIFSHGVPPPCSHDPCHVQDGAVPTDHPVVPQGRLWSGTRDVLHFGLCTSLEARPVRLLRFSNRL
jgi:hypothetical protein